MDFAISLFIIAFVWVDYEYEWDGISLEGRKEREGSIGREFMTERSNEERKEVYFFRFYVMYMVLFS